MLRSGFLALCAIWLNGCAAVGLSVAGAGAGAAMGAGIEHAMTGIVYKTFTAPLEDVRLAADDTLRRMDMSLTEDEETPDGRRLAATAANREIGIDLERVSPMTTRMRVSVNRDSIFFKDGATGSEIIAQTTQSLDSIKTRARAAPVIPAAARKPTPQKTGKKI